MKIPFYPAPISEPLTARERDILRKRLEQKLEPGANAEQIEEVTADFAVEIYNARQPRLRNLRLHEMLQKPHYRLGLAVVNLFRQYPVFFFLGLIGTMYYLGLY